MKINIKDSTINKIALMSAMLLMLCTVTNAQPGYRQKIPRTQYPSNYDPYSYTQRPRQGYDRGMYNDYVQRYIKFGVHFDPLISWFSADNYNVRSEGAVPGFSFGVTYNRYFSSAASFSSGINIISAGGKLSYLEATSFELNNYGSESITIRPGEQIAYRMYYLSVPVGLKFQSDQIGYGSFFADLGLDPKILVEGRADIPSHDIAGGNAGPELRAFSLSYHIMAGMEYPLSGFDRVTVGIGLENNFSDITKDKGIDPMDVVTQKMVFIRIGLTF